MTHYHNNYQFSSVQSLSRVRQSAGGCEGAQSAAKRSYPTSEVRVRSLEDPMPKGQWPSGVTPRPRSGAVAKSARLRRRRNCREELPQVQGQGQLPRVPGCDGTGTAKRSYPMSEVRGGSREEVPRDQGQGWRRECQAATEQEQLLRGATPNPRPGAAAGRSNPTSKEQWLSQSRRA